MYWASSLWDYKALSLYNGCTVTGLRRVSGLRREPAVSVEDPAPIHTFPHISLKNRTQNLSLQTPTLLLRVLCTELATRGSKYCFSVGNVDRCIVTTVTAGPYVIPRPGVPRHVEAQRPLFSTGGGGYTRHGPIDLLLFKRRKKNLMDLVKWPSLKGSTSFTLLKILFQRGHREIFIIF